MTGLRILVGQRSYHVGDGIDGRPGHPVRGRLDLEALVDPTLNLKRTDALRNQSRRFRHGQDLARIHKCKMVGAARFELATSCTRNKRATRLRYAPNHRPTHMTGGKRKCNAHFSPSHPPGRRASVRGVTGTILNATAILIGGLVGLSTRAQPSPANQAVWKVLLGLFAVYVGLSTTWQALPGPFLNLLKGLGLVVVAMILGNLTGKLLRLQKSLNRLGRYARELMTVPASGTRPDFNSAFVACVILYCISPIAVIGALQDGLAGNWKTLAVKAVMDGLACLAFVRMLGWGVLVVVVPLVAWLGSITLAAQWLAPWLQHHALLDPILATSGMLVFSIALVILDIKRIELADYLPSLLFAPLLAWWIP